MKSFRVTITLAIIFTSTVFGQFSQADSVGIIQERFQRHSIYLQDAMFIFNYKIIQNDLEHSAGKHFKDLPLFMTESPKDQKFAMRAIERRQLVDNVTMAGMVVSLAALYKGITDKNITLAQVGFVG